MAKAKIIKSGTKEAAEKKPRKIQWHPAFGAALEMEFVKDKDRLSFEREHNLNRKPLLIDCLIIKKEKNAVIENEIGKFFKQHNIIEYKSEKDALSIDVVSKVQGYAHLYKAYGGSVNEIKFDDISATLIRESKPEALFKYFTENEYKVSNPYNGIYYIENGLKIPTQIIVGRELKRENHIWLNLLSDNVTKQEMAIEYSRDTKNPKERNLIDAILDVSAEVNSKVVEELKRGDESMSHALMEIMKPEIDAAINAAVGTAVDAAVLKERNEAKKKIKETAEHAIRTAVKSLRRFNASDSDIKKALMEDYGLSEQEALSYLE